MSTRATPGTTSAPSSPSSRAPAAPTNSESQAAARADVVDPWTATITRRVSDPPLRSSKPVAAKSVGEALTTDGRKGRGRQRMALKKSPHVAAAASVSESEEKAPAPTTERPKKTPVPAPEVVVTSSRAEGFDLNSFLDSFQPGVAVGASTACSSPQETGSTRVKEPVSTPEVLRLIEELRAPKMEVHQLRGFVGASEGPVAVSASATVENTKGELPPAEVFYWTSGSFPDSSKKAKGATIPHKPTCRLRAAKSLSVMSFVLWLRKLDCVKFYVTPTILMAIFSGRLGSRGLSLLHYRESTEVEYLEDVNVNFTNDFSPSTALPAASTCCTTYDDILDAVHGLSALGQECSMTICANLRLVPEPSSARTIAPILRAPVRASWVVRSAILTDDPRWWTNYCESLKAIDYQSHV
ncbi:LOW QUALITY PROTEIN: hypothetical protein PHMEG_00011365 [Phytophthora megakarya]|uniref:Uncharacterized protein n=1 Tax=Phytophthora megakarya TaxID=4795 RepID=A0A225WDF3_9STRA|nr:LOW QUALITY PROTEIN: hypothetical protein PHMEG_00011365 [Phytophthora megakarya]